LLSKLDVGVTEITDEGLKKAVATVCPLLVELGNVGSKITEEGVKAWSDAYRSARSAS